MNIIKRLLVLVLVTAIFVSALPAAMADSPKLVALTFDDGPGLYTARLLDGLLEKDVRATFFCLGSSAERYPELIKRIVLEGHQLANHSWSHPNLNEMTVTGAIGQISTTDQALNQIVGGAEDYYVRPPYGNITQAIRNNMLAPAVIWSVDTIDWQLLNREAVKKKILNDTFDGAIVLMHDIHWTTVEGVLDAIDTLRSRGYEFVTVKELLHRRGVAVSAGQLLHSVKPNSIDSGVLDAPEVTVAGEYGIIQISFFSEDGAPIYYTLDGSGLLPGTAVRYEEPITVPLPCQVRAVAAWDLNGNRSREVCVEYTLPPTGPVEVCSENGRLAFHTALPEDTVYVALGESDVYSDGIPFEQTAIPRDCVFSFYACADGYAPTVSISLLFTANGNLFSDVSQTDWFYAAMDHCVSKGYYRSDEDFVLNPSGKLTRAMLVELLYRQAGEKTICSELPFTDVPEDAYYYNALIWAFENGIVNGVGNDLFAPNRNVSRQELAKILSIYLNLEPGETKVVYEDQDQIASWAVDYVQRVTNSGLMHGSSGHFRPNGTASRAEMAALLQRLDQFEF